MGRNRSISAKWEAYAAWRLDRIGRRHEEPVGLVAARSSNSFRNCSPTSSSTMPTTGKRPPAQARRWSEWNNPARVLAELLSQRPSIPLPRQQFGAAAWSITPAIRR